MMEYSLKLKKRITYFYFFDSFVATKMDQNKRAANCLF